MVSGSTGFSSASMISKLRDLVVLETQAVQIIDRPKLKLQIAKLEAMNMCAQIHEYTYAHMINRSRWIFQSEKQSCISNTFSTM